MEELKVSVKQTAGKIECNFDEIKQTLKEQMSAYEGVTVSEDEVPIYKKELAALRKFRTAVDTKRKEVKNAYEKPYNDFKEKVDELLAEIDKPIELIDNQLKLFEEDRIRNKRERVSKLYAKEIGEYAEYLPIEKNYDPKWDNKSCADKDIVFDISALKTKVMSDLSIIKGLGSEIEEELLEVYKKNDNNLGLAIQRNSSYVSDKIKVSDQIKRETESKQPKEEPKPSAEAMGALNEAVEAFKTVHFIVSAGDADEVENLLKVSGLSYRRVEG